MENAAKNTSHQKDFIPRSAHEKALQKIELLEFELAQIRRMLFGTKSERFIPAEATDSKQLDLFGQETAPEAAPPTEQVAYTLKNLKKKNRSRYVQRYRNTYHE